MKKLLFIALLLTSTFSYAQFEINGGVTNKSGESLVGATVVLLEASDSTMYSFALTDEEGKYIIEDIEKSEYILQVSYIAHNNYSQPLNVNWDNKSMTIDDIMLSESSEVLQEVTIQAEHIPMGLRGDTISYNAAAFKTRPNATVEDLLKKLPGIEVERNGNIKAQGEDVENVLVDGKEFFGNDPTMATKNLQAEAVDKVEVFDKQSEIAEFTGVDDGMEEKTINLKLKEDFKTGGFGHIDVAGGTDDRYVTKMNYFRFSPTLQASVIGARNNINKETFTINDRIDFMGGIGSLMSGGTFNIDGYEPMSDGLNTSTSLGANFNYDFSSKLKLVSHYLQTRLENDLVQSNSSESFNQSFTYESMSEQISDKSRVGHQINSKVTYKASPYFNLTLRNNVDWNDAARNSMSSSMFTRNGALEGNSQSLLSSISDNLNYSSQATIKNKFGSKGRNLISNIKYTKGNEDKEDNIENDNNIALNNVSLIQDQFYSNEKEQFDFNSNYTEPIGEKLFFGINYAYSKNTERPNQLFFDLVDSERILNDDLSSSFRKKYDHHLSGVSLRKNFSRIKLRFGLNGQFIRLKGDIADQVDVVDNTYRYILPGVNFDYKLKGGKNLTFNYRTNVVVPTLQQLLPFVDNRSATSAYIGNPSLQPEYRHSLSLNFSLYDNFNFTNLWTSLSVNRTQNRVVNKRFVDDNLFATIEPINTDRYIDVNAYLSFSRPFKTLGIIYKIRGNMNLANYDSFINNLRSPVQNNTYDLRLSINNRKTDFVNIETGLAINLNTQSFEINPDFNQTYFNTDYFLDFDIYLSKTWTLSSDFSFRKYSNEMFADSPSYKLWSASISKLLFNNKLEIRASVFDILNENIGFRRYGGANSVGQMEFNNLGQYFLLGLNYKIGKGEKKSGIRIETN